MPDQNVPTVPDPEPPAQTTVQVIDCPRAPSLMAPCIARDGDYASSDYASCLGCEKQAADLFRDLVGQYVDLRAQAENDWGLRGALQMGAVFLRAAGGRVTVTEEDLATIDGQVTRTEDAAACTITFEFIEAKPGAGQ